MLAAYALSGDELFKEKAQYVADKILPAFRTPTGVPYALINFQTGMARNYGWTGGSSILSEFGTNYLEFAYLSDITGKPVYRQHVETIRSVLKKLDKPKGLYPSFLDPATGQWGQRKFKAPVNIFINLLSIFFPEHMSLGAFGDSFYEYLLKTWLQSGQTDDEAREMYDEAMSAIMENMVIKSPGGLTYVTDLKLDVLGHTMDHLSCFSGGLFGLGATTLKNQFSEKYMEVAKGITNTCHESYIRSHTRLGPDIFEYKNLLFFNRNHF